METEYNLAINELKNKKMALEKETSDLIKEKDKVMNEIAQQRRANTEVYHEQLSLLNLRYFLDEQTKILSEIRDKNYQNFSIDYTKHTTILSEIGNSIEISKKLLSDFHTSKEDVRKLEERKDELNKEIKAKRTEL